MDKFVSRGVANDAAADVDDTPELTDGEGDNEPHLEEPEEPEEKKVNLNYGAKTTPASRARQYPSGAFEVRGDFSHPRSIRDTPARTQTEVGFHE